MQSPSPVNLNAFDATFNGKFKFEYHYPDATLPRARLGILHTPHGSLDTPAFIFCGTKATVKGLTPQEMKAVGAQIILSNTYHLMLQPGSALIHKMGGLHKFMGWDGPMLTDSGGFQIFSLGHGSVSAEIKRTQSVRPKTVLKIDETGATFRSYIDGAIHHLTPERAITVQQELGPDLILVLDECTPFNIEKSATEAAMLRSHRWGQRSLMQYANTRDHYAPQALYGILQGGVYPDLRQVSADFVNAQPFFGHAIGGSLGATKEQMYEVVDQVAERLATSRPIHLLGIGSLRDIFSSVILGIDTFDCVHPTRLARHGGALVPYAIREATGTPRREHINLWNSRFIEDPQPLDASCSCEACSHFSRSYLHHLLKAGEMLVQKLITLHNVATMNRVMSDIRSSLRDGSFKQTREFWLGNE